MFWLFGITESLLLQFGYTTSKESTEVFLGLKSRNNRLKNMNNVRSHCMM